MIPVRRFFGRTHMFVLFAVFSLRATCASINFIPDRDTPVPADQPVPVIDFARPELFEEPVINPDGTYWAAFSKTPELKRCVIFCEIATGKLTKVEVRYSTALEWITNYHVLAHTRVGEYYAVSRHTSEEGDVQFQVVVDARNPTHNLEITNILPRSAQGFMPATGFLWREITRKTDSGWEDIWNRPKGRLDGFWSRPEDGDPGLCTVLKDDGTRRLYRYQKKSWIECPVNLDDIQVVFLGKDGEVLVTAPGEQGKPRAIQKLDTETGKLGPVFYQSPKFECTGVRTRPSTREIIGVTLAHSAQSTAWLDPKMQEIQTLLNKQFDGSIAEIGSSDIAENRFVVRVYSDRLPGTYYIYEHAKKSLSLIKNTTPWIDPKRMRPMLATSFKARDGVKIDGFLTLPDLVSKEHPVPLIVAVHAGPWGTSYNWGWDNSTQYYASRGYAVFDINYRGSSGYDHRAVEADRYNIEKMHQDLADGVRVALKSGVIDARRVAIMGYGFGSYLAMCGVLEDPETYRCAVLSGGVYDWAKTFRKVDSDSWNSILWLKRRLGAQVDNLVSPMKRSAEIKIPVFLTRNLSLWDFTNETQVTEFTAALKRDSKFKVVTFGDFNIYREEDAYSEVADRYEAILKFLDEQLSPGREATPPKI